MAVNSTSPHSYLQRHFPERYRKHRGVGMTLHTPVFRSAEALFVGDLSRLPASPDLAMEARPKTPNWETL